MTNEEKRILEAFIKNGILEDEATSLDEIKGYGWEYDSLAEELEYNRDQTYLDEQEKLNPQFKKYEIGDIVFARKFYSTSSRKIVKDHRILVITSQEDSKGVIQYRGFELSSKVDKSNKLGKKYPNNLYIKSYASILSDRKESSPQKEVIIRVDDLVKFNSKDLSSDPYVGHAKEEFLRFVLKAQTNHKSNKDEENFNMCWEK